MATRTRTLLLSLALGFGAATVPAAAAAATPSVPVQDPGATFGGVGSETSTTVAATTAPTATTTEASGTTTQTLVEAEDQPDTPIFTESRKVAAVIGGLVCVALAILLLTIRYVRVTKPVADGDVSDLPMLPEDLVIDDGEVFVADIAGPKPASSGPAAADADAPAAESAAGSTAAAGGPGTDHSSADDDWEPRTDEHQRVEIPAGTALVRPNRDARRKALGLAGTARSAESPPPRR